MGIFDETVKIKELQNLKGKYPIPYLSYSQLNSYMKCPETYRLTYLAGERKFLGNKYTVLGSVLHEIMELQGKQLLFENPLSKAEAIRKFNTMYFNEKHVPKEFFTDKEEYVAMYKKGITAIENYYSVYEESTPLYLERKFFGEISPELPPFKSFIDRIEGDPADPSTWTIVDYKSGSSVKSKDYLRKDIQLGLYVAQVFGEFGAYPKAVSFFNPVPNKFQTAIHQGDGLYRFTGQRAPVVEFSVSDILITVRDTVKAIITDIENDSFEKRIEAWECKNCFKFEECKPFDNNPWGKI